MSVPIGPAGGAATVIAEAKHNRIMVSGSEKEIERIEAIVRQLDPPSVGPPRVILARWDEAFGAGVTAIIGDKGLSIAEGQDIETDYYNFTALNFPVGHPARDMQDTFWLPDNMLLRSHTTTVQARVLDLA